MHTSFSRHSFFLFGLPLAYANLQRTSDEEKTSWPYRNTLKRLRLSQDETENFNFASAKTASGSSKCQGQITSLLHSSPGWKSSQSWNVSHESFMDNGIFFFPEGSLRNLRLTYARLWRMLDEERKRGPANSHMNKNSSSRMTGEKEKEKLLKPAEILLLFYGGPGPGLEKAWEETRKIHGRPGPARKNRSRPGWTRTRQRWDTGQSWTENSPWINPRMNP